MAIRYFSAFCLAIVVALGLFSLMNHLIMNDRKELVEKDDLRMVDFVRVKREDTLKERKRELPKKPPPKRPPPPPEMKVAQSVVKPQTPQIKVDIPKINMNMNLSLGQMGSVGIGAGGGGSGDAIPKATFPPQYPRKALRAGIEGWVEVEFTVTILGKVEDIRVIKSKPKKIFDKEAKRSIAKWTFKPAVVDGKPVATRKSQVIEFAL